MPARRLYSLSQKGNRQDVSPQDLCEQHALQFCGRLVVCAASAEQKQLHGVSMFTTSGRHAGHGRACTSPRCLSGAVREH
jgi:hypothetical protein